MTTDALARLRHIKISITLIKSALTDETLEGLLSDSLRWSGFERQLEIISEASRHIPNQWKSDSGPDLDWSGMAGLGNLLRHTYHHTNAQTLWSIYLNDLDPLEAAIDRMLATHGKP